MTPGSAHISALWRQRFILLLLVCSGPASNLLRLEIPLVFLLLPGNLFALLVLRLYGPAWGIVAAAAANSVVPLLVGHPFTALVLLLEIAFIARLERSGRQTNLILADALFWVLLGSPLVLISFVLMGSDFHVGLLVSAKSCINGIANASVASLLLYLLPLRRWLLGEPYQEQVSLKHLLTTLMIVFLIVPGMIMTSFYLRDSISRSQKKITQRLTEESLRLRGELSRIYLAMPDSFSGYDVPPAVDSLLQNEGALGHWHIHLITNERVICSNHPPREPSSGFSPGTNADLIPLGGDLYHRIPHIEKIGTPLAERWNRSSFLLMSSLDHPPGTTLVVEAPIAPLLPEVRWTVTRLFGLFTAMAYVALFFAWLLSRRIATPLTVLSRATNDIPLRLQNQQNDPIWPNSPVSEIHHLIANCREMTLSLREQFEQIRRDHQTLEHRVEQRTHDLAQANEALMHKERHLKQLAHHDPLTELPNRLLLQDRLELALVKAQRHNTQVALLFLDLDRFKTINDSLGHTLGDRLLCEVAHRLRSCVRASDTVARFGGDEFMVVIDEVKDLAPVAAVAQKILQLLAVPMVIDGYSLYSSASIGISVFPLDARDVNGLMQCADIAMYRAKEAGRNSYQFFTADMNARAHELLLLESDLRKALDREQLLLHYQPQYDLRTGDLIGLEALIRWQHPEHGLISPANFIPLAEETGLIVPIGEWVMRNACEQNLAWQQAGLAPVVMAVNISARQFRQVDLADQVTNILQTTNLQPCWLELELTESMIMGHAEHAIQTMKQLNGMGIMLALDDFGSGYSSLAYLKRFPINKLKIAQEFMKDVLLDGNDAAIASAVIALGNSMGMTVIAEGVETLEQLAFLKEKGCHQGQGYLFSRPVPASQVQALLKQQNRKSDDFFQASRAFDE